MTRTHWSLKLAAMAISAVLVSPIGAASAAEPAAQAAAALRVEERNKQTITRYLQLLGTGDVKKLEPFLADDIQWIIPQDPTLSRLAGVYDKAGLLKLLGGFGKVMPNGATFTPIGMTAEGDRLAVEVVATADTPAGPFRNQYHFLYVLRDGKIVVGKEYADSLFMQTFGTRAGRESPR